EKVYHAYGHGRGGFQASYGTACKVLESVNDHKFSEFCLSKKPFASSCCYSDSDFETLIVRLIRGQQQLC
ncbi:13803_t:CDS:2, partial [Funneliformis mosseae]